ncbi:sulfatase-like hydrolase/transferase [Nocardioides taihuensis]|uniref:Sulfatase-like hydrolase/transferase n=1 Tax=Nocardioides taihuensis TaxID=1835606 RepID=A0ABW0BJM0_9ACTN
MPAVQLPPTSSRRRVGAVVITVLAGALVLLVLTAPDRLEEMHLSAFVRLPVEVIVFLALVLAIPPRWGRVRTALAVTAGLLLAVAAVFRVLDLGFLEALNRPFDPLIDWQYAGSLVETVRGSAEGATGVLLLVAAGLLVLALLVLVPLAVVRITRVAGEHRTQAVRLVAVLASLWLALGLLQVRTSAGAVSSGQIATYLYGQVARIPSELRDQREFARAAETDPLADTPGSDLFTALRGKDVLVVFVESYGRVAVEDSSVAPGVDAVLAHSTQRLTRDGLHARSAWLTSPTFGALSWLAHSTLQSGLWVDSEQRYDHLVTSPRLTLSRLFARAGWRTVADVPANTRDWPQGEFYGYDHVYDSRNVGYRGPRFGYPTMPDQYTLDAFHRLELAAHDRRPVMAEIDLVSSHAPWSRTPRMIPQASVGDGSAYDGMPETLPSETDIWPDTDRVRAAYGDSIEYSLRALTAFLTSYADKDTVVVVLGDHQPATIVSGTDAGHDVPVSVIARDPAVTARISGWDWTDGLRPAHDAPVWRMDAFRDRFVAAYGPGGDTGTSPGGSD